MSPLRVVIKVGGSLMNYPYQLREILKRISFLAEQHNVLVVPGGGESANQVRDLHTRRFLSDSGAHWLAIRCMDLNANILADIQPSLNLHSGIDALEKWAGGKSFIIEPYELLKSSDRLPHTWDVTSDSIALWLGIQKDADAVLLVKSVRPYFKWLSDIQSETEPALPESLQFLIDKEIIDRYMAQLHSKFKGDIYVLNGLWLENLSEIIVKGAQ